MEMTDQKGQKVKRTIKFSDDGLSVSDKADSRPLTSFLHVLGDKIAVTANGAIKEEKSLYAEDYGLKAEVTTLVITPKNQIDVAIDLRKLAEGMEN